MVRRKKKNKKPIEEETRLTLRGDAVVSEGEEDDAPTPPPMFYDIAYESDNRSYEGLPTSSDKVGTASKLIFKKFRDFSAGVKYRRGLGPL